MKRLIGYGSLVVGYVLISLPLYAQGLFPGIQIESMKTWMVTFAVGAIFTVLWYVVKRFVNVIDELNKSVVYLTTETRLDRQNNSAMFTDMKIIKKRLNGIDDWRNKHNLLHARCELCPDEDNHVKTEGNE
jgi:hypothetical protein